MDFAEEVRARASSVLRRSEGACGIYHAVLAVISELNGQAVSVEIPEGTRSKILDAEGRVVGEGIDITWSPATLKAMIDGELIPKPYADELKTVLTKPEDLKAVKNLFGYGRVVRPAAISLSKVVGDGGYAKVRSENIGVTVSFSDKEGKQISSASNAFCPACAVLIATANCESLADYVKEKIKGEVNTGRIKYEKNVENCFRWKDFRVEATLKASGKTLGESWGCCTAYAIVRAELASGLANSSVGNLLKAYCDQCPVKHVWFGKSMGALGNIVLRRVTELGLNAFLSRKNYLTLTLKDDGQILGEGIGSLCALSASINLLLRSEGVKIIKPEPGKKFPQV
mgnify:CR=1 FL=1